LLRRVNSRTVTDVSWEIAASSFKIIFIVIVFWGDNTRIIGTSDTDHPATQPNISDERKIQWNRHESLKTRMVLISVNLLDYTALHPYNYLLELLPENYKSRNNELEIY
jgi:hypothetical protein